MSASSVISWMLARSPRPSAISRTAASMRACLVRALRRSSRLPVFVPLACMEVIAFSNDQITFDVKLQE